MSLETTVAWFAFGWAAGLGTAALAARSARGARRAQLLRDAPPGWRSYAPVSRPRHANSDNGAPTTVRPPIEPQGQAPIRIGWPVSGNLRPWSELKAEFLAHQANVARIEAEQASAEAGRASAAARRSDIWQPQANKAVQQLADEGNRDPAKAVINDASRLWMRHDMSQPPSRPQVQVREPYSPSHVAECGGPCERIGICDCGNPPNLSAPGKPLHPAPQANS